MNISKASTVNITLSVEEIEKIVSDYIMQDLHARLIVHVLPNGSIRDHKVENKGFTVSPIGGQLTGYSVTLTSDKVNLPKALDSYQSKFIVKK